MVDVKANCTYCRREVVVGSTYTYQRVTGWEHPRSGGGTNALALRHPLDEYACSTCIDKQRRGVDPGQGSLLGGYDYGTEGLGGT